jgi:hypothetical protein
MMHAAAATADPVTAALAIARAARRQADRTDDAHGFAAVAALAAAVLFSLLAIAAMLTSPATIPIWCAAHGGCP